MWREGKTCFVGALGKSKKPNYFGCGRTLKQKNCKRSRLGVSVLGGKSAGWWPKKGGDPIVNGVRVKGRKSIDRRTMGLKGTKKGTFRDGAARRAEGGKTTTAAFEYATGGQAGKIVRPRKKNLGQIESRSKQRVRAVNANGKKEAFLFWFSTRMKPNTAFSGSGGDGGLKKTREQNTT